MATLAQDSPYRRVTVEEFLEMDFGGARAELVDGVIHMMAGGLRRHNQIQMNLSIALGTRLRGSGCRPYGPDQAVRTGPSVIRYPDVSVYCDEPTDDDDDDARLFGDPSVVFEVASKSTMHHDQRNKLPEYQALAGVDAIVLVVPDSERIRLVERQGPESWTDRWLAADDDLTLARLGITLPRAEIFARD